MFGLIEEEGMTEQMGGMYEIPARLYYKLGNFEKALEYTLKAKHEIDGYGPSGEKGEKKLKLLDRTIEQMKEKIKAKREKSEAKKAKSTAKQGKSKGKQAKGKTKQTKGKAKQAKKNKAA